MKCAWHNGWWVVVVLSAAGISGCSRTSTNWEYMPGMMDQISIKASEPDATRPGTGALRAPVPGTVSRDFVPYPFAGDPEAAGVQLANPLPRTMEVLAKGQQLFGTYCLVCHGTTGLGDGPIVPRFPRPPSLLSDKVQQWPDGRIFHVMTEGQNVMPSYAAQVTPEQRWAIVHYVRVLQRAGTPTKDDMVQVKALVQP